MKLRDLLTLYTITAGVIVPAITQAAAPVNLVGNGDFETGDFSGWTIIDTGSGQTLINTGSHDPLGNGEALPPISGRYDALTEQPGPGLHVLQQKITVPMDVFSARLSWNDRVRNWAYTYSDPNQEWRVLVKDVNGNVLQEVYSTNPGDLPLQTGPNARFADMTGLLQLHAGEEVVISFEEEDNLGFFNATLDDVVLLASVFPATLDDCKKDGWTTFVNVNTGNLIFRNQGDCVSFVATKYTNQPAYY